MDADLKRGYLTKRGHRVHNWKRRFFVLTRGQLRYYTEEGGAIKGELPLANCVVHRPEDEQFGKPCGVIKVEGEESALHLTADVPDVLAAWEAAIQGAALATASLAAAPPARGNSRAWEAHQRRLGRAFHDRADGDRRENLELALRHYEAALGFWSEARQPLDHALASIDVADVLRERLEGDASANAERAIQIYSKALDSVFSSNDTPNEWAIVQTKLASAYRQRVLGDRRANVERAKEHYVAALDVYDPQTCPGAWAMVQNNLANLFAARGDHEAAVGRYNSALEVYTVEAFPAQFAMIQTNLGASCGAGAGGGPAAAPAHFEAALQVYTRAAAPAMWATAQRSLGRALWALSDAPRALEHLQLALDEFGSPGHPAEELATTCAALARVQLAGGDDASGALATADSGIAVLPRAQRLAPAVAAELYAVAVEACTQLGLARRAGELEAAAKEYAASAQDRARAVAESSRQMAREAAGAAAGSASGEVFGEANPMRG